MLGRIEAHWVYGGTLAALILLLLVPTLGWPLPEILIFLALPAYMIHQFEEHDDGRFKSFINDMVGDAHRGLDDTAIFVVNFFGVWVLLALVILAARLIDTGWGAVAAYLMLINGIVHVMPAILLKRYNPGLVTGVALFGPLGTLILITTGPDSFQHLTGFGGILALHILILLYARSPKTKPIP
ncbi:MAG: HXXEE domain-containing protein [Pseudomonadota bacterium]